MVTQVVSPERMESIQETLKFWDKQGLRILNMRILLNYLFRAFRKKSQQKLSAKDVDKFKDVTSRIGALASFAEFAANEKVKRLMAEGEKAENFKGITDMLTVFKYIDKNIGIVAGMIDKFEAQLKAGTADLQDRGLAVNGYTYLALEQINKLKRLEGFGREYKKRLRRNGIRI